MKPNEAKATLYSDLAQIVFGRPFRELSTHEKAVIRAVDRGATAALNRARRYPWSSRRDHGSDFLVSAMGQTLGRTIAARCLRNSESRLTRFIYRILAEKA